MATTRLNKIANRQRRHLVFDVLFVALAAFILVFQVVTLSGSNVPVAKPVPQMAPETIYIFGDAPNPLQDGKSKDAMAATVNPAAPASVHGSGS